MRLLSALGRAGRGGRRGRRRGFGPGPQLIVAGETAGQIGRSVAPPGREAQVQQLPAFIFVDGQGGDAALHAAWPSPKKTPLEAFDRAEGRGLPCHALVQVVVAIQRPVRKFWFNSMASE